jgi:hypothetical protein
MGALSLFGCYGATVQGEVVGEELRKRTYASKSISETTSQGWGLRGGGIRCGFLLVYNI